MKSLSVLHFSEPALVGESPWWIIHELFQSLSSTYLECDSLEMELAQGKKGSISRLPPPEGPSTDIEPTYGIICVENQEVYLYLMLYSDERIEFIESNCLGDEVSLLMEEILKVVEEKRLLSIVAKVSGAFNPQH